MLLFEQSNIFIYKYYYREQFININTLLFDSCFIVNLCVQKSELLYY